MVDDLKDYLKITWQSEDTELQRAIDNGKALIDSLVGSTLDYSTEGLSKQLLFDYCRYRYHNATEYFQENFAQEILHLQIMTAINEEVIEE